MPTDDDVNARMLETVTCDPLVPGVPRRRAPPPGGKMDPSPGGERGGRQDLGPGPYICRGTLDRALYIGALNI